MSREENAALSDIVWTPARGENEPELRSISWNNLLLSDEVFGGKFLTAAEIRINPETALQSTVLLACCRILAETVSVLPLHVYRKLKNGHEEIAEDIPLAHVLGFAPNGWQTKFEFFEQVMMNLTLWGNSYTEIKSGKYGSVTELNNLHPSNMRVERLENGRLKYTYNDPQTGRALEYTQDQVMHIRWTPQPDGVKGMMPVEIARDAIALARACEIYASKFWANMGRPGVVLQTDGAISAETAERLRDNWERIHRGVSNAYKTAILTNGLRVEQFGATNTDSQYLDVRKFQGEEIARCYRLPLHLIQGQSGGNLEVQGREFVDYTLMPWLARIEQAISRSLIYDDATYKARFDVRGLLRGDSASRASYYSTMMGLGIFSINDVRRQEGMAPLGPDADKHFVAMNLQTLEDAVKPKPDPSQMPGAPPPAPGGPPSLPEVKPGKAPMESPKGEASVKKLPEKASAEARELLPQDEKLEEAQQEIAEEDGKWEKEAAHYIEKNPFAARGIKCHNCTHYFEEAGCKIVRGLIAGDAICKLWVIPPEKIAPEPEQRAFCPTGEGNGIKNDCSPGGSYPVADSMPREVEAGHPALAARAPFSPVPEGSGNSAFAVPPSDSDLSQALIGSNKTKGTKIGKARELPEGTPVALRIDIPAFNHSTERMGKAVYAITIHEDKGGKSFGSPIGYDSMARLSGPVRFEAKENEAIRVATGESTKTPLATVKGKISQDRTIPKDVDSWTPVGYDPKKAAYFYDKRTGQEVKSGVDALSVGNTVFTRRPQYGDRNVKEHYRSADEMFASDSWGLESRGFCPTGEGGGIDNSCGRGDSSGGDSPDGPEPKRASTREVLDEILRSIEETGGYSVHPVTAESPTTGFMCSTVPGAEKIIDGKDQVTEAVVDAYFDEHRDYLSSRPKLHLGGWIDGSDGKVYLDLSERFETQEEAEKAAVEHNQLAIWDIANKKEIRIKNERAAEEDGEVRLQARRDLEGDRRGDRAGQEEGRSGVRRGEGQGGCGSPTGRVESREGSDCGRDDGGKFGPGNKCQEDAGDGEQESSGGDTATATLAPPQVHPGSPSHEGRVSALTTGSLLDGSERLDVPTIRGRVLETDLSQALTQRAIAAHGGRVIDINDRVSDADMDVCSDALAEDLDRAAKDLGRHSGWYSEDVGRAVEIARSMPGNEKIGDGTRDGELHDFVFSTALGILSQENTVPQNARYADAMYRNWVQTGSLIIPEEHHSALGRSFNAKAFEVVQTLADRHGWDDVMKFFSKSDTVGNLVKTANTMLPDSPYSLGVSNELVSTRVPTFALFGPKIGAFTHAVANRERADDAFDFVVKDRWLMRQAGSIFGTLMSPTDGEKSSEHMSRVLDSIKGLRTGSPLLHGLSASEVKASLQEAIRLKTTPDDDSPAMEYIRRTVKAYAKSSSSTNSTYADKTERNLAANNAFKNRTQILIAPGNGTQSLNLHRLFEEAAKKSGRGNVCEAQALGWVDTQRLWQSLGYKLKTPPDQNTFSSAFSALASGRSASGRITDIAAEAERQRREAAQASGRKSRRDATGSDEWDSTRDINAIGEDPQILFNESLSDPDTFNALLEHISALISRDSSSERRAFCPTGEGGGVKNDCPPSEGGSGGDEDDDKGGDIAKADDDSGPRPSSGPEIKIGDKPEEIDRRLEAMGIKQDDAIGMVGGSRDGTYVFVRRDHDRDGGDGLHIETTRDVAGVKDGLFSQSVVYNAGPPQSPELVVDHKLMDVKTDVSRDPEKRHAAAREFFRIMTDSVQESLKRGVSKITLNAAGDPKQARDGMFRGYTIWPRMGFNAPIPNHIRNKLPPDLGHCRTLLDLHATPDGTRWWKKNGTDLDVQLDLTKADSPQMQVFGRFVRHFERDRRDLAYGTGDEWLSPADEVKLDELWQEVWDEGLLDDYTGEDEDFRVLEKRAFCPTGEGGGVKNDCSPNDEGGGDTATAPRPNTMPKAKYDDPRNKESWLSTGGDFHPFDRAKEPADRLKSPIGFNTHDFWAKKHGVDGGEPELLGKGWMRVTASGRTLYLSNSSGNPPTDRQRKVAIDHAIATDKYDDIVFDAGYGKQPRTIWSKRSKKVRGESRAFCATGEGGGIDNSCGAGEKMAADKDSGGGSSSRWGGKEEKWGRSSETEIWTPGKPLFPGAESLASIKITRPNDVRGIIEDGLKMKIADAVLASGPVADSADRSSITRPRLEIVPTGHGIEMRWTSMGVATGEGFKGEEEQFKSQPGTAVKAAAASRDLWITNQGPVLNMGGFFIHPDFQGKGLALESVAKSSSSGVIRMEMQAERFDADDPNLRMTGYKVWPKYGYDAPLSLVRGTLRSQDQEIPKEFSGARTLADIFRMPGGREWWSQSGDSIRLVFDCRPRSKSVETLLKLQDRYRKGR